MTITSLLLPNMPDTSGRK